MARAAGNTIGTMWRQTAALTAAALLAGCAARAPAPPPKPTLPDPPAAEVRRPAFDAFEAAQHARAARYESEGRWAEAEIAREVLTILRPDDPAARDALSATRNRIAALAAERAAEAEAAQRRGDLDAAAQALLEALALQPDRRGAADTLRAIERERERRRLTGRNARVAIGRRSQDDAEPSNAESPDAARRNNSLREHAALLSRQGDLDGAIALLREPARGSPGLRSTLVDLYVTKAETLRLRQPDAARAAVDAALALDRRHAGALALQRQLARPASRPASSPAANR